MRRSVSYALATVSLTALVTVATSSQAITPASLGQLKQLDKWKVGIVDPEGQSFCAMVNKFDKNFGLAFALSPEGYGSVAVDVTDAKFTPGDVYQVALKTNGSKAGTYPGRATSERSVVVQVGQNKAFYDALKGNAALGVGLPALNVEFSLNKFAQSYRQLIDCSQSLVGNISAPGKMPAVEVKEVEKASLAPLDRELAEISGDELADANTTDDAKDKDALFDAVEAKAESNDAAARTQLAALDAQQQSVKAEIGAQKQKSAEIADEKQQVERKLIASTKSHGSAPAATATGATAKLWDAQATQVQPAVAAAPAATAQQIEWNDAEAAKVEAVEAEKTAAAAKQVDEYSRGKEKLDQKAAAVKEEAVKIEASKTAAPENKALKASLVAKQAELARISAERVAQTSELTRKLSATQSEYDAKLSAIAAERDALKTSLATAQKTANDAQKSAADAQATAQASTARATALQGQLELALEQNTAAKKSGGSEKQKLTELQTQVLKAEQEKQALQERLAKAETEGRSLAAVQEELDRTQADKKALEARLATVEKQGANVAARAKQMESATGSDSKQLAAIKASLASEKASHEKETASLRTQMDGQNTQFEELKATYIKLLERSKQVSASADKSLADRQKQLTEELASRDTYVAQLETKLAVLESERAAANIRAASAQEDVSNVRREMQGLRKSLIVVNDDDKPAAVLAAKRHAEALAAAEAEVNKAEAALTASHTRISTLESQLDTTREQVSELQKSAAKMTTVAATAQTESDKQAAKNLEQAQAEIARLKSNTADLEGKLFNATAAGKNTASAKQALADNNDKLAAAEAEIEKLKSDNMALAGQLVQKAQQARLAPVVAPSEKLADATPSGISAAEKTAAPEALVSAPEARVASNDEFAAPVVSEAAADETVSAPIPSRKPAKSRKFDARDVTNDIVARNETRKPVVKNGRDEETARANEAAYRKMAAIEPAAGASSGEAIDMSPIGAHETPAPTISRSFFDGKIPAANTASEPVVKLRRIAAAPVEPVIATPVAVKTIATKTIVATPVVAVPAVQKDPSFDENRAAAFLDRIMSHHRPNGSKAAARSSYDAAPVFSAPKPVTRKLVMTTVKTSPADLSRIETAAGGPAMPTLRSAPVMQPVMQQPLVQDDASEFPAPVMATPLNDTSARSTPVREGFTPAVARVAPVRARVSGSTSVETILSDAGISDAQFTGGGDNTRQWTTNGLSGMYEHTATQGRSFGENAQGYIARYRGDCSQLAVNMGPVQKSASGSFARADISCPIEGNTYTTAMVFWQDAGSFNAVLHSGYPDDGAQVKGIADNVASVIGGGSTAAATPILSPRTAIRRADAIVAPAAERQYRFNIREEASASYQPPYQPSYQPAASYGAQYGQQPASLGQDDFETLVIE